MMRSRSKDTAGILVAGLRGADSRACLNFISAAGFETLQCDTHEQTLASLDHRPGIVFLALYASDGTSWLRLTGSIRARWRQARIVALAFESSEELAIEALRAKVDDYIHATAAPEAVIEILRELRAGEPQTEAHHDSATLGILGESRCVAELRTRLGRLSNSDCNVLITGESGTGKELAAAAIHRYSNRKHARLVCLNCAAIPDSLLESELFGYERGAFTGADATRDGKLKAAEGGVIFRPMRKPRSCGLWKRKKSTAWAATSPWW